MLNRYQATNLVKLYEESGQTLLSAYKADQNNVIQLLICVLATGLTCMSRYRQQFFVARDLCCGDYADDFLSAFNFEKQLVDQIIYRIVQLGGDPNRVPVELIQQGETDNPSIDSLVEMLMDSLLAERIAIISYRDSILAMGEQDPDSARLLKGIIALKEKHADDLDELLDKMLSTRNYKIKQSTANVKNAV